MTALSAARRRRAHPCRAHGISHVTKKKDFTLDCELGVRFVDWLLAIQFEQVPDLESVGRNRMMSRHRLYFCPTLSADHSRARVPLPPLR